MTKPRGKPLFEGRAAKHGSKQVDVLFGDEQRIIAKQAKQPSGSLRVANASVRSRDDGDVVAADGHQRRWAAADHHHTGRQERLVEAQGEAQGQACSKW